MNFKLLAVVMIIGFLFSTSSSYLNQLVFADDPWSDIASRQQASEQKALAKYMSYYQFANLDQSRRDWSGLNSTATDETSRGRDIPALAQLSLQNAVSQFDIIHILKLANLTANDYTGLTSTPTDTQGRDRNAMIDSARASSLVQANDVLNQIVKVQQNYANFAPSTPTDTNATYDRQVMIWQNMQTSEAQAALLVSKLATIDQVFLDLTPYVGTDIPFVYKPGSITNQATVGRNIPAQSLEALDKAVQIFNEIHAKNIVYLKSSYYGLTSTPTDTQGRDRNVMLAQAQQTSMTNALRVYNSYYNGVGLR